MTIPPKRKILPFPARSHHSRTPPGALSMCGFAGITVPKLKNHFTVRHYTAAGKNLQGLFPSPTPTSCLFIKRIILHLVFWANLTEKPGLSVRMTERPDLLSAPIACGHIHHILSRFSFQPVLDVSECKLHDPLINGSQMEVARNMGGNHQLFFLPERL